MCLLGVCGGLRSARACWAVIAPKHCGPPFRTSSTSSPECSSTRLRSCVVQPGVRLTTRIIVWSLCSSRCSVLLLEAGAVFPEPFKN